MGNSLEAVPQGRILWKLNGMGLGSTVRLMVLFERTTVISKEDTGEAKSFGSIIYRTTCDGRELLVSTGDCGTE